MFFYYQVFHIVGLEKMERDKQKQLEKEREKQESQVQSEKVKLSEKDAMDIIKSTVKEQKSKYVSDCSVINWSWTVFCIDGR